MLGLLEYSESGKNVVLDKGLASTKYLNKYSNRGIFYLLALCRLSWNNYYLLKDFDSGEVIGAGCIRYKISAKTMSISPWLYGICIEENKRGIGYGSILLEKLIEKINLEYSSVFLKVDRHNTIALGLYTKFGFTSIENRSDNIIMQKHLDKS